MNLKDFLKEEKEERKKIRQEQKKNKKQSLTKEQKKYKIFGIIFAIFVIVGALIYSCNNMSGNYSWNNIIGINEDIIEILEQKVDENKIFSASKLNQNDWNSCNQKLLSVGIDFSEIDENSNIIISEQLELNSREIGALSIKICQALNLNKNVEILYYDIFGIGEDFFAESVIKVNMSNYIKNSNLPSIYIKTKSKIEVLNNSIFSISNEAKLNNVEDESKNNEIITILNENSLTKFDELGNNIINSAINVFVNIINSTPIIQHDKIIFK